MSGSWVFPSARILIFAKAPTPGLVKTRLIPALSADRAAALHRGLVEHSLRTVVRAGLCPAELWCSPTPEHRFFIDCAAQYPVSLYAQQGQDLGERMAHALCAALKDAGPAVLIGTDSPALTEEDLKESLTALDRGCDVVLGPAEDGGYYLIGLQKFAADLFHEIPWGTDTVLDTTRSRVRAAGLNCHELRALWDLDRPDDLHRLDDLGMPFSY